MYCPVCNNKETKVVDSRVSQDGDHVRRRRECEKCSYRFSTAETVELFGLTVVKRDGRRVPYDREKLLGGLARSLEKRSYTEASFKKLVNNIERGLQKMKSGEITTAQIGEVVMRHLKKFDKVAYIRFASVYRLFEDASNFEDIIREVLKGSRTGKKTRKK